MLLEYKVVFPLGQYKSETLAIQNMFTITFFVKTIKKSKIFLLLSKLLEVVLEVKAYLYSSIRPNIFFTISRIKWTMMQNPYHRNSYYIEMLKTHLSRNLQNSLN